MVSQTETKQMEESWKETPQVICLTRMSRNELLKIDFVEFSISWQIGGHSCLDKKNNNTLLRRTKIVVFLQRQSEEFAERMTTFMAITVVSSLNINEPSLFRGGFVFCVGLLRDSCCFSENVYFCG
jgi:hypothetical protein